MGLAAEYEAALGQYLGKAPAEEVRTVLDRLIGRNAELYERVLVDPQFRWREDYEYFVNHRVEYEAEQQRQTEELEKALTEAENERRVTEFHKKWKPFAIIGAWLLVWGVIASAPFLAPGLSVQNVSDPEQAAVALRIWTLIVGPFSSILLCVTLRRLIGWAWQVLAAMLFAIKLTREKARRK